MEMGAGDTPSPPPRYNAPRSALYTAKMSAMATPTPPAPRPPATAPSASAGPGGNGATGSGASSSPTATGSLATSPLATGSGAAASPTATGSLATSPLATGSGAAASPMATGSLATSPPATGSGAAASPTATGSLATSPLATGSGAAASPTATGSLVTSPLATGSGRAASPTATGSLATSPLATGSGAAASPTATGSLVTSPLATGSGAAASPTATGSLATSPPATGSGASSSPMATGSLATSPLATGSGASSSPMATGSLVTSPPATGSGATSSMATASLVTSPPATGSGMVSPVTVAATSTVAASPSNLAASPTATGHVVVSLGNTTASPGSMAAATSSRVVCPGPMGNNTDSVASPVVTAPVATMAAATGMVSMEMMQMAGVDVVTGPMETVTVAVASPTPSPATETAAPCTPVKPLPAPFPSPSVVVAAPNLVVPEKSSPTATEGPADLGSTASQDMGSQSSLGPGIPPPRPPPAPDTLSYLDSVSLMSGTLESLSGPGFLDDVSSLGSDSEINGLAYRRTDKYGFLGGNQHSGMLESTIPVDVARQRELKWLDMFSHWDKWLSRRFQKVKLRCRKGIPSSLRAKAWQLLSNSKELLDQNPGKFEELERQPGDPKWLDVIEKDLHRQFPFHEMFAARGGHGQQDLYRILKAYTIYRPDEGYCQAQAPVAAVLLMHMPAEQAFWCLVQICEKYLPGYYSAGLEAIQLDGEIFFALLRRASPMAYRHLKKYKIDPILYMTEWFMCIFSRTLPWASVLRVWDMFFCEGVKIVFRVGLVLLRNTLGSVDKLRSCQGMYETMEKLRNLPAQSMQEDFLIQEVVTLPVTEALIERENATQLKKWRETRGELQHKPSRRLHGSRAIHEECHRLNPPLTSSASLLSLTGFKQRAARGGSGAGTGGNFSPAHPMGSLAVSSAPTPAAAPGQVVSEGLHPALPSPTGNNTPLGGPKKGGGKKQEKERERLQKEREKQEKKEKEKVERKQQKERAKEEAKLKKERKVSMRRKEAKAPPRAEDGGQDGDPPAGSVLQDTYF
ncbi:LOW QUALITY PROTEIN: TBC1 domain family member 10B [Gopherus flavomarginatus]|uniref:LOW QUALITY PROTEIN: TBC1 domain family member 10B n=1 Tax=Gopherus flavomarginatus TaxID=286002 RepID=UPI0021CBA399|nr:LOW QUALITY PROTEIN: TBC1 domain family member 10B [Gopherus flavomarginatus]